MVLNLQAARMTLLLTRDDVDAFVDLDQVTEVDWTGIDVASHCFADELYKRIGHPVERIYTKEFVQRISDAGYSTASRDW